MGQINVTDNSFRTAIIKGMLRYGARFTDKKNYLGLNYGLIIKPLNLEYSFREPIKLYFNGYPYHVGIIRNDVVYSFCPDLREPHRGTLKKDILIENVSNWQGGEIFWFLDDVENMTYMKITSRLVDLISVRNGELSTDDYNERHKTNIKMLYNLLSNNCTDIAMTVLIGKTVCFQIESIVATIVKLSKIEQLMNMLPPYAKMWLNDFKYVQQ